MVPSRSGACRAPGTALAPRGPRGDVTPDPQRIKLKVIFSVDNPLGDPAPPLRPLVAATACVESYLWFGRGSTPVTSYIV